VAFLALSLAGFLLRSDMSDEDVNIVERKRPGFVVTKCRWAQDRVFAQLQKRYDVASFGQTPGAPTPSGTTPPAVTFTGIPLLGDLQIVMSITSPGALGASSFSLSLDGGQTLSQEAILTGASVPLPGTGLSASFGAGTYLADNVYTASTPVPETILHWIAFIARPDVFAKRGWNPANDSQLDEYRKVREEVYAELEKAANSQDGLFDLPLNRDAGGSGITQGGPLGYSETSPYVWQTAQRDAAESEDDAGAGTGDV